MKYLNRKSVAFGLLVVLLAVSGYLNIRYNGSSEDKAKVLGEAAYVNNEVEISEDVYESLKIQRNTARDESVKSLNEIINNPNSTQGAKTDAENEVLFINQARIQEADCESILINKGIEEVMVSISRNGVNVFVKKKELHPNEIAIITETIKSNTVFTEENIKISTND